LRVPVELNRWPFSAFVRSWGRDRAGGWWGLITWNQRVRVNGERAELAYAGWVPAEQLRRPQWAKATERLPRIELVGDTSAWPNPLQWHGHYIGSWPAGPPPAPDGAVVIMTPAWRDRD
jgi:hypothetical protein